jgi:hypothetical protein
LGITVVQNLICDKFDIGLGSFEAGVDKINHVDGEVVS